MFGLVRTPSDPKLGWLVRDGKVLASLEVAQGRSGRGRGLLGRDGFSGAMLIEKTRSVHSFRMRFELDVAVLDSDGVVIKTLRLRKNRITAPMIHARSIVEAEAGTFSSWDLQIGDQLEVGEEAP